MGFVCVHREIKPTGQNLGLRRIHRMKIVNFIHITLAQAFYRWAMAEINPMIGIPNEAR